MIAKEIREAERQIKSLVRDHDRHFDLAQLVVELGDDKRGGDVFGEDVVRAATWYLIGRKELVVLSDWKLGLPDRERQHAGA